MEGGGVNPAVNPGGELASSAPQRMASHDPGSASGRGGAAFAESLAEMKKRRKE